MDSVLDVNHCNRQIKFKDALEQKIETLDTINVLQFSQNKSDTDRGNENNSSVMFDMYLEDDTAILKRTRYRARMTFYVNALYCKISSHLDLSFCLI